MRYFLRHIIRLLAVVPVLSLSSCYYEEEWETIGQEDKMVRVELFTRAASYDAPVSRISANEDAVGGTPWILVFKGSGNGATYVEASQAFTLPNTNQTFVALTKGSGAYRLLILANPQGAFYANNSAYTFSKDKFDQLLSSHNLEYACNLLLTEPLTGTQSSVPFLGQSFPMSCIYDLPGGINAATEIGTTVSPVELIRAVAKVIVKSTASNFTLLGVTAAYNFPHQGQLHRLGSVPMTVSSSSLVSYKNTGANISDAVTNSTAASPIYLFESEKDNDSYIVIKGKYLGTDYYYKMAFVDGSFQKMDLLRNYEYTFTIVNVYGEGHETLDGAVQAPAYNNTHLDIKLTVTDLSAYETTAFDDYYLSVSNSVYIGYGNLATVSYDICSIYLVAEGTSTQLPITGTITSSTGLLAVTAPTGGINVTTSSPQSFTLKAQMASGFVSGEITLRFGNLKKVIEVKKNSAKLTAATVLSFPNVDYGYYMLSGKVDNFSPGYWIKLSPYNVLPRDNDAGEITVDDGRVDAHITAGSNRTGTVYFSTVIDPSDTGGTQYARRIKLDIVQ